MASNAAHWNAVEIKKNGGYGKCGGLRNSYERWHVSAFYIQTGANMKSCSNLATKTTSYCKFRLLVRIGILLFFFPFCFFGFCICCCFSFGRLSQFPLLQISLSWDIKVAGQQISTSERTWRAGMKSGPLNRKRFGHGEQHLAPQNKRKQKSTTTKEQNKTKNNNET